VDLGEILRVMRTRWYIVVPMLLLAIGLGAGAYLKVPTKYTTSTMVSLLNSPAANSTAVESQDNPFLNFNSSLVATADFLGRRLQSTDVEQELKSDGVTDKYTVALAENAQGPFLTITVTGTDKTHVLQSATTIAQTADAKLVQIQQQNGVASRDMIRLTQIIPPQKPQPELKKKLEFVIAAAGGTLALAFILTFVVESISRGRKRRQLAGAAATATATAALPEASVRAAGSATVGPAPVPPARPLVVINGNGKTVGDETKVLKLNPDAADKPVNGNSVPGEKTAVIVASPRGDTTKKQATPKSPAAKQPDVPGKVPAQPAAPAAENAPRGKAPVAPAAGTARVAASTTYQSKSADAGGRDADRVNGS
jgi:capsular polysaccharide biosynthesis protein